MKRWQAERLSAALVLGVALTAVTACEKDASGLTEWTPADHDHQAEPRQRRTMANMAQKASPHAAPSQKNQVIDVTWSKQCATCHGRKGKGDGPSSTMVKARDLTNPEFQASVSDEQLAKVIREGKDKMPAFNLPDSIVQGLVQHVRAFAKRDSGRGRDNDDGDLSEAADEAAAGSAAPGAPAASNAPAAAGAAPNAPASTSAAPPGGQAHGADTSGQPPTLTPAPAAAKAAPAAGAAPGAPGSPAAPASPPRVSPPAGGATPPAPPANHP